MIRGLELFKKRFSSLTDHYILIGGTACTVNMEQVGLTFRATKDLDIVLYVEALTAEFVSEFWKFIKAGGYKHKQQSTGKQIFYRFSSPHSDEYPVMLELFSRAPDDVKLSNSGHLTPIPTNDSISSLSAILLDDAYYQFIHAGKLLIDGLSVLAATHLIPLKARAWMDLSSRKKAGLHTDGKDIRKHKQDILRLYHLLSPTLRIQLPPSIKQDMQNFLDHLQTDRFLDLDLKNLGTEYSNGHNILQNLKEIYVM